VELFALTAIEEGAEIIADYDGNETGADQHDSDDDATDAGDESFELPVSSSNNRQQKKQLNKKKRKLFDTPREHDGSIIVQSHPTPNDGDISHGQFSTKRSRLRNAVNLSDCSTSSTSKLSPPMLLSADSSANHSSANQTNLPSARSNRSRDSTSFVPAAALSHQHSFESPSKSKRDDRVAIAARQVSPDALISKNRVMGSRTRHGKAEDAQKTVDSHPRLAELSKLASGQIIVHDDGGKYTFQKLMSNGKFVHAKWCKDGLGYNIDINGITAIEYIQGKFDFSKLPPV
jgi:transcription-repair coupling factor (superfamily II helicase)